jgi:nitrite reductase (NADH) small subunit
MTTSTRFAAATVQELAEKGRKIVTVKGMEYGIFLVNGTYYAWRNICPHAAAPICEGTVCGTRLPSLVYEYEYGRDQEIVRCPWHGWEFDLKTGQHLVNGSVKLRGCKVEVEGDQLYLQFA